MSSSIKPGGDGSPAQALALLGRLQAACASDTNASLLAAHMTLSCAGRMRSASASGVVIEIPNPPRFEVTLLGRTTAVTFPTGDGLAAFVSVVTDLELRSDGALRVSLELPPRLRLGDRRGAVRIPVPRGALTAAVVDGYARYPVQPVDLSLTGVLIEVTDALPFALGVGRIISIAITRGEREVVTKAEVCRGEGLRYGLRFLPVGEPPRRVARFIYDIQELRRPHR